MTTELFNMEMSIIIIIIVILRYTNYDGVNKLRI